MINLPPPRFLFITCQRGAEPIIKDELARKTPFRFAYSRPGFLTFKLPGAMQDVTQNGLTDMHAPSTQVATQDAKVQKLPHDFRPPSVFARSWGFTLGKAEGTTDTERAEAVWRLAADGPYRQLHVWQRDAALPGEFGFEPGASAAADGARKALGATAPATMSQSLMTAGPAGRGQVVLDCIVVEPDVWWVGYHRVVSAATRWPGGVFPVTQPADAVSRAYAKMEEAIAWSQLPIRAGDRCVEIGSAPGGSSQALLAHGLTVIGIDPAKMDPRIVDHPAFIHVRKRGIDVQRRLFQDARWLAADMNVAPRYTLDTVEAIVTHRRVSIRGLLLTLKLLNWELAAELPDWLARIRSWGYHEVRARQLARNRREICVVALQHRALRRVGRKPTRSAK
ncbi:MAG: SAM-dependent methyltransferase [Pirellulales bacterium]